MIKGFNILLKRKATAEELTSALAGAYKVPINEIELQYQNTYDVNAPDKLLTGLVYSEDDGNFPTLLSIAPFDSDIDVAISDIASKISNFLICDALIQSDSNYDDDTMLYISGLNEPKLVLVYEEHDEISGCIYYKIVDYQLLSRP